MAWFKPEGWENLSQEDQAWMREAKALNKVEKLRACVLANKPERLRFVLKAYSFSRQEHYQASRLAVINQSAEPLRVILNHIGGFNFDETGAGDREAAFKLFKCVAPEAFPVWKTLCVSNKTHSCGQLAESEIIGMFPPKMSRDFLRFHLDEMGSSHTFGECIKAIGLQSTEELRFILAWSENFENTQYAIDSALVSVAEAGDADKTKLLLENKADPNYSGGISFLRAVEKGNREIIDLLLPHMDLETHGESLMGELRGKRVDPSKIDWLEKTVNEAVSAARARKSRENYTLVDADTLAETKQLPSGMKLTTLFNFKSSQQTVIVEKAGEKESLAVAVKDFNEIGNDAFIEAMRLKLVELGGKADDISRLPKKGLTRD